MPKLLKCCALDGDPCFSHDGKRARKTAGMEQELHHRVIGQNEAVDAVLTLFVVAVRGWRIQIARLVHPVSRPNGCGENRAL